MLETLDLYHFLTLAWLAAPVLIISLDPKIIIKTKEFLNYKDLKKIIIMSVIYAISSVAFFASLDIAPTTGQVSTISRSGVILTVVLSVFLLKERKNLKLKILGAIISMLGLVLITQ